jgi:uncharacterized membrane protein (UPF0127 family)
MTMTGTTAYVIFPDGFRVAVLVANTETTRARGLMFRDSLDEDDGMLFTFDVPGRHGFWMKNVRIPLDMIWLDDRARVVWIVERAPPCAVSPCPVYQPQSDASYVVEVVGGFVAKHAVRVGQSVTMNW